MRLSCQIHLIFLISIFTVNLITRTNSLKLNIENISSELTNLATASKSNLLSVTEAILNNESLWPFLVVFSEAKRFNFNSVLITIFTKYECEQLSFLIKHKNFPVKQIMTADLISLTSKCLALISVEFFEQQIIIENPLDSIYYRPSHWKPSHHIKFLELGLDRQFIKTNWYVWCNDQNLSMNYLTENRSVWSTKLWKTISFYCISELPENLATDLLEILSPDQELLQFNLNDNNTIRTRALTFINRIVHQQSQYEIDFAINQVMRIITISTYIVMYNENHPIRISAIVVLQRYLRKLGINRRKFPMRRKLKQFIQTLLKSNEYSSLSMDLSEQLINLTEICRGKARGTWLLNIFIIWGHFRDNDISLSIRNFLNRFLSVFFAVESLATVPDVCLLFKYIKSLKISKPSDNVDDIISFYISGRPDLAQEIFKVYISIIPTSKLMDYNLFPVNMRVEYVLKITRSLNFVPAPFSITLGCAENVCTSIVRNYVRKFDLNEHKAPEILLPLNARFVSSNFHFQGNLPKILRLFFKSLLNLSSWFNLSPSKSNFLSTKPVLIPSLMLPPQFLEPIGFLIGRAVSANVEIPFFIERKYFQIRDAVEHQINAPQEPIIFTALAELYPQLHEYTKNLQLFLNIKYINHSINEIFKYMRHNNDIFLREDSNTDAGSINNSDFDMKSLILLGSERFWFGLNLALPIELLETKHLYNLIFK